MILKVGISLGDRAGDETYTRETAGPSRTRPRVPSPVSTEAPASSRRRRNSPQMEPSRASVDCSASLYPHGFLTPDEVREEPRYSVGADYHPHMFDPVGLFDVPSYQEPIVEAEENIPEAFETQEAPTTFWPGESSRGGEIARDEELAISLYAADALRHPESHDQYPTGAPQSGLEGEEFISEIYCDEPSQPKPRLEGSLSAAFQILQDAITQVNPGSPDSLVQFPSLANNSLHLLARFGMEKDKLKDWVFLCREVEYTIAKIRKLGIMKPGTSLPELQKLVEARKEAYNAANDAYGESSKILDDHRAEAGGHKSEMEKITSRLKKLFQKTKDAESLKSQLEANQSKGAQAMKREQRRKQQRYRDLMEAEAALTSASEALRAAEEEYVVLGSLMSHIKTLQARLQ